MFKRKDPSALQAQLASLKGGQGFSSDDKNEWKLSVDSSGNGQARIRFLPGKGDDSLPFVKLINHGFKKNGKWYIENCTSSHGDYDSCPVCQYLSANDSYNTNEAEYKLMKRKISFWSNIIVIKDPAHPENEGKVFKYRFGIKVMDKINAMVEVDSAMGEVPVDVTCPFEGADFSLKVKKVGGFQNYDESKFFSQSEIPNIDDETFQKQLFEQMNDLNAIVAPDQFKTFEQNETKFKQVMGTAALGGGAAKAAAAADKIDDDLEQFNKDMKMSSNDVPDVGSTDASDDGLDDLLNSL